MKILAPMLVGALVATPAFAHPGHFATMDGHSHWLAAGALALGLVVGAVALWRRRARARKAERARKA